ncbi:hypothetical protein PILCRDRAFT_815427 [Piloderma croceum F 1598]|uniref:Major facilitator superfamily (MFS) profile domain-containing protein n=1 Tax=Piloderma croceum (strain F 1598) TaxID=765440 RepID=A0A0C3BKM0_PILCF|nr:hypothetical protein PILCRDRAFT_815427 [Piloderma croceum F 1598]
MPADETSPLLPDNAGDHSSTRLYTSTDVDRVNETHEEGLQETKPAMKIAAIVIPMSIGIFLAAMDGTIVLSAYAAIGSELNQLQSTSWIATGYLLTLTSFQPLYGKLSDIFGRKACLLFAYAVFAIGSLFCGLSHNMTQLIAARALAGVGGGGMTTVASIIMSDIVPLRSRGTWQGLMNIVFATGSAAGAPLGGLLADSIGWRWAFLLQVPATIIAISAVTFVLELPRPSDSDLWAKFKRVDFVGALVLVSLTFFLLFGLDRGGNISWTDKFTVSSLVAFAVLFILFCTVEMLLASEPFAPRRIIVNRSLFASYLVNFFGTGSSLAVLFYISLYFQAVQSMTAMQAGLWLLPSIGAGVCGSLGGGLTMQATGKFYWLTVIGYCSLLVGTIVVTLNTGILMHSLAGIVVGLVILTLGNGSGITTSLIALIANAGPEDQAIATALSYLFRSLGSVVALSIGSTLFQDTLRRSLHSHLSGLDADEIVRRVRKSLSYIDELDPVTRTIVRSSYEEALHTSLSFLVILAAASSFFSFFIKETPLVRTRQ